MSALQAELLCCTQVICNEIEQGLTQNVVAATYALAIRSEANGADKPDWPVINRAIMRRWSPSGLKRVKKLAWECRSRSHDRPLC